jgi:Hpt domain
MACQHAKNNPEEQVMPQIAIIRRTRKFTGRILQRIRHTITPPAIRPPERPLPPPLPADDIHLQTLGLEFGRELLHRLLAELPMHRREMAQAHATADYPALRHSVHRILGAVVYCECGPLEEGLRELRRALKTEDPPTIDVCYHRLITTMDTLVHFSGNGDYTDS